MKRFSAFLLAAFFLFIPITTVYADLIIEPDNSFYGRHRDDCVWVGRSFFVSSAEGSVTVMDAPDSTQVRGSAKNDTVLYVYSTYDYRGTIWGVVDIEEQTDDGSPGAIVSGWVKMDQLRLKYDNQSFMEDHRNDFHTYSGDLTELKTAKQIVFWTFPDSGVQAGVMVKWEDSEFDMNTAYVDADGRDWGYISYYYGYKNVWVCLSDPSNENIPASNVNPQTGVWDPGEHPSGRISIVLVIAILVVILAAATAVLIHIVGRARS